LLNNVVALLGNGAGSGSGSFESIATVTGTGSSDTITFSSIPSTYKHLQLRILAKNSGGTSTSPIYLRFNGDSTTLNYAYHELYGNGTSAVASGATDTNLYLGSFSVNTTGLTDIYGAGIVDIHDYASTSKYKTVRSIAGANANTTSTSFRLNLNSGLWQSTSAINSISVINLGGSYSTSSTIALFGIKG
jgi:hypothetical protein